MGPNAVLGDSVLRCCDVGEREGMGMDQGPQEMIDRCEVYKPLEKANLAPSSLILHPPTWGTACPGLPFRYLSLGEHRPEAPGWRR